MRAQRSAVAVCAWTSSRTSPSSSVGDPHRRSASRGEVARPRVGHWHAEGMKPVQVPASQQTPFAQLGAPMQFTLHDVPEQLTRLLQDVIPVQLTIVSADLLETVSRQARAPPQSTAHVFPVHEIGIVQESGFLHRISHDGASHRIAPVHVPAPVHATLHLLPLHAIRLVHAPAPMQLMSQELALVQSTTDVHDPAPVQVTVHGIPGGQTMGSVQVPAAVQSMAHVPAVSHVPTPASAHREGHAAAASIPCASLAPASASTASEDDVSLSGWFASGPSASLVPASSGLKDASGNEHAAPATAPALANEMTMNGQRFFMI